jgi:hypothetical protein
MLPAHSLKDILEKTGILGLFAFLLNELEGTCSYFSREVRTRAFFGMQVSPVRVYAHPTLGQDPHPFDRGRGLINLVRKEPPAALFGSGAAGTPCMPLSQTGGGV